MVLTVLAALTPGGSNRGFAQDSTTPREPKEEKSPKLQMPNSLRLRHEAFHDEFTKATKESGKVGDAARVIEKLGTFHFAKAKDAFAPLGLLPRLAEGKVTPEETAEALKKAEQLKAGLPNIHREHRELVAGLKRLAEAAKEQDKTDYVRFAERLSLHIQEEEEVLYPAVLLIGKYAKGSVGKQ